MFVETVFKTEILFYFGFNFNLCCIFFSILYRCGACSWILYFQEHIFVLFFVLILLQFLYRCGACSWRRTRSSFSLDT